MGKRERERRRQEARRQAADDVATLLDAAVLARRAGEAEVLDDMLESLARAGGAADRALSRALEAAVGRLWRSGWQPADVVRVVRRERSAAHVQVVADAIGAEARRYAAATIDHRWADQLATIREAHGRLPAERAIRLVAGVDLLAWLAAVPPLPKLLPLPGEGQVGRRRTMVDGKLLDRVRALLAKAESTTFPEEADALTAKAQELMARHAIDMAMLQAGASAIARAEGRRIGIDDPYARPKAALLGQVASANRCQAVWLANFGCADVFGAGDDLDAVELLFTSLLRQATASMVRDQRRRRSFRQSFLVAFAVHIGRRLRAQDEATRFEAEAAHGPGVLPVLASRTAAAEEAAAEAFPHTRRFGPTASDPDGWAAGAAAAERADLGGRGALAGGGGS